VYYLTCRQKNRRHDGEVQTKKSFPPSPFPGVPHSGEAGTSDTVWIQSPEVVNLGIYSSSSRVKRGAFNWRLWPKGSAQSGRCSEQHLPSAIHVVLNTSPR